MTSVLFSGNDELIGKIVKVKIQNSNQNTLFGKAVEQSNQMVVKIEHNFKKNFDNNLKFVYSENNTLSVIFHNNDLLMGCW